MNQKTMISAREIRKSFGALKVLRGISFDVESSETLAIIGRSGSGKSTMLRCLNMLESWEEGEIFIDGELLGFDRSDDGAPSPWSAKRQAAAREQIGMVFQQFNLFPHMTVLENVMVGPRKIKRMARDVSEEIAVNLLSQVGLPDKSNNYPAHLSGGQQQRVAIARALALNPKILLLDEITSALDPELVGEVLEVIAQLRQKGMTMVLVTHEIQFAHDVADRVLFMDEGKVVEAGPPGEILDNPKSELLIRFLTRFTATRGSVVALPRSAAGRPYARPPQESYP